jgi:hypothetical protein
VEGESVSSSTPVLGAGAGSRGVVTAAVLVPSLPIETKPVYGPPFSLRSSL